MRSIRSRAAYQIAINFTAAFAISNLLLGGAAYIVVSRELDRQNDGEIASRLDQLAQVQGHSKIIRDGARSPAPRTLYALFNPKGERIAGELDITRPEPGFANIALVNRSGDNQHFRARAADLADGNRLVVALDASGVDQATRSMLKLFLVTILAILTIGIVGGVLIGGYLHRRLRSIGDTANAVIAGDLSVRVPADARDDEFSAAGHALNLMLDRIAALMESLRQVSNDIAHDLRRPLIRLLCQTDRLGLVEGAEERVMETGDEMLELFAAILRTAEIEGGNLQHSYESLDLSAVIYDVAETFAPALLDAGDTLEWTIEPGISISGNRELLAQLTANLLDNARIHTPAGTAIYLTLTSTGPNAQLQVEDDGPGVSEEDRGKLLQRFFRADASRTTPGNGLGLSLVAATATAHGGAVIVENGEPGLRIIVTLPRLQNAAEGEVVSAMPSENGLWAFRKWFSARRES